MYEVTKYKNAGKLWETMKKLERRKCDRKLEVAKKLTLHRKFAGKTSFSM